jgi:cation transport ATPase
VLLNKGSLCDGQLEPVETEKLALAGPVACRLRPADAIGIPATGRAVGLPLFLSGRGEWANRIWFAATPPVLLGLSVEIFTRLRGGDVGLDVVAAISTSTALILGENLAAVVAALTYAGGPYLEDFAAHRARRDMTALLACTPRNAIRHGKRWT